MSGIAAIYNLDDRPADDALLSGMTGSMAHRGGDGEGRWVDGPVALGHRSMHTTSESLREHQPVTCDDGARCITMDGRVDNRDELLQALGAFEARHEDGSDAELVLRAYERWGEESPRRILGDFAFVIWDRRHHKLFCARDPLGIKPLYYHADAVRFRCGSEISALLRDGDVAREPNPGMIGEYLTAMITSVDETLYRGIYRLPPAHSLTIEPGRLRRRRYWDIDPAKEIRYRSDDEFAAHFLELFQEAVRCRLRSHRPVGAYLSGGLDSSAVVCAAESLRRRGLANDLEFETFSHVYPGRDCDESPFIDQVVRMWNTRANAVSPEDEEGANWYAEQVRRYLDFPDYPGGNSGNGILSLARAKGIRVLLTGFGGDEWLSGSSWHYADLLRELRIFELLRRVRSDQRTSALAINPIFAILQSGAWPLVPRRMRRALRAMLGRNRAPAWLNRSFARRIGVVERTRHEAVREPLRSFAQAALYLTLNDGGTSHALEMEDRSASLLGLEQRHPFHDRRIVEFAHALPEEQRCASGETRSILRRATSSLVPEGVRRRQSKAEFSHCFVDALRALGGARLYESLAIASEGWVDGPRVRRMHAEMERLHARGDTGFMTYVWPLWMIFGIELWFTIVFLNRHPMEGRGREG